VLYAIAAVGRIPVWTLARELMPYIAALIVALAIVSFFPATVTWLPNIMMGAK
jgi:C4-dicarboxylate transporter DctM subunit